MKELTKAPRRTIKRISANMSVQDRSVVKTWLMSSEQVSSSSGDWKKSFVKNFDFQVHVSENKNFRSYFCLKLVIRLQRGIIKQLKRRNNVWRGSNFKAGVPTNIKKCQRKKIIFNRDENKDAIDRIFSVNLNPSGSQIYHNFIDKYIWLGIFCPWFFIYKIYGEDIYLSKFYLLLLFNT